MSNSLFLSVPLQFYSNGTDEAYRECKKKTIDKENGWKRKRRCRGKGFELAVYLPFLGNGKNQPLE